MSSAGAMTQLSQGKQQRRQMQKTRAPRWGALRNILTLGRHGRGAGERGCLRDGPLLCLKALVAWAIKVPIETECWKQNLAPTSPLQGSAPLSPSTVWAEWFGPIYPVITCLRGHGQGVRMVEELLRSLT